MVEEKQFRGIRINGYRGCTKIVKSLGIEEVWGENVSVNIKMV